jgi:hypothetical protein
VVLEVMGHMPAYEQAYGIIRLDGTIEPGKVFDSTAYLDGVPADTRRCPTARA